MLIVNNMKFKITTEKGGKIEMELGQEIELVVVDKETELKTKIIISIKEKHG